MRTCDQKAKGNVFSAKLLAVVVGGLCSVSVAHATNKLDLVNTHPSLFKLGSHNYVGKKWHLFYTDNQNYYFQLNKKWWGWSGPETATTINNPDGTSPNHRYVTYGEWGIGVPDKPNDYNLEISWGNIAPKAEERWLLNSDNKNHKWSGMYSADAAHVLTYTYSHEHQKPNRPTSTHHDNRTCTGEGVNWPTLDPANPDTAYAPFFAKHGSACQTPPAGTEGYIYRTFLPNESPSVWNTMARVSKCDTEFPADLTDPNDPLLVANRICKTAPNVGIVDQRYLIFSPSDQYPGQDWVVGCERVVYTWGYAKDSGNSYKKFFRNGELKWKLWGDINGSGARSSSHIDKDDDGQWEQYCRFDINSRTAIYSGTYKLTNTLKNDNGL